MELNKKQVADRLGVTTRAVERYMSTERPLDQRLIPARYQSGRGGQQPVFESETVDAFKLKMEEAAKQKRETPAESTALARVARPDALQALAALLTEKKPSVPVEAKFFLTIRECSELSGLSQKEIKEAVKSGALKSRPGKRGAVVVGREDLQKWAGG